ncbi:Peptidoglycan-binding domain 1 [hydrothermal vent metagenome]|uniref:Peptidoglycan-binding domain 1 n=1 Tax=hydrothermal vent metagenome TaxID=652676 RepID=A0A1W1EBC2_9ZZZZ
MTKIKFIILVMFLHAGLYAQAISMDKIGENIETSIPKILKGKNLQIVEDIYKKTGYKPLWVGKVNKVKTSQLIQALNDPLFNYKNKSFDQKAIKKLYFMLDNNSITPQKKLLVHARLDLMLTNSMVRLVRFIVEGDVDWNLVQKKLVTLKETDDVRADWEMSPKAFPNHDQLINAIVNGNIHSYLNSLIPMEKRYKKLITLLKNYRVMDKFPKISYSKSPMALGDWNIRVSEVKKRLQISGDFPKNAKLSWKFDKTLENAVKTYQKRYLLEANGKVDNIMISYLNQPVKKNIQSIITNLDKTKLYGKSFEPEHIELNIPDFNLRFYRNHQKIAKMGIVVGRQDRPTPIFSDKITYMVINPTWTVTDNLIKRDLIPILKEQPDYLETHNFKVFSGKKEVEVNYEMLEEYMTSKKRVPYRFVQYPGDSNALGRVKFMFPNKYSVYLHDTDNKTLLERRYKLYSSGCVRVDRPFDLVDLILQNSRKSYTKEQIQEILDTNKPKTISLKKAIPIHILYFTVYEEDGLAYFKNDIYSYDKIIEESVPYNKKSTFTLPKRTMRPVKNNVLIPGE